MIVVALVFPLASLAEFVGPDKFGKRRYQRNAIRSVYHDNWCHHIITPVGVQSNSVNTGISAIVGVQGRVETMTGIAWC